MEKNRAISLLITTTILVLSVVEGTTDSSDIQALQVIYSSLNNPSQLTNWKTNGGDPCGESWKGVTCQGSAVVSIQISGLGLSGTMGYLLASFLSLRTLDMSNNNIHDTIPYQLPPNLMTLNLGNNNLSGNLPYSISSMVSLSYLNFSRNSLSQAIGDMFSNLTGLATLDLSFNNFTSDLPSSFIIHVQNNQLTGSLNVLANLPLTDLNVANNHFSGWIPRELISIPRFIYDGNSFDNGPAPPPPPYTSPPPGRPHNNRSHSPPGADSPQGSGGQSANPDNGNKKALAAGPIIGIALGSSLVVFFAMLVIVFCLRKGKRKEPTAARTSSGSLPVSTDKATNSFSQENLIGEGSLGRVYRGEFPNGKVVAIKKIDNAALSLQEEDNFLEAVSNMSRLRHPNIIVLVGYCAEHGQRLLVYDYIGNGSLQDMLHFADERGKMLTWNARVRVALGTARALEYLHEVCLPSVVHRNFKSANILLDEELNPHLSDCGLAALTPNTERQVSSTQMVGSFGYSAPEFALSGIYTVKSDVYSFGVVMLELLTGRKPLDSSRVRSEQSLVRWATPQLHDIDALAKMVDPALDGMYPAKSLSRFADIIALCVQPEPEFRPPMSEVVQALVRLMQRASVVKRRSSDESVFMYKTPDHEATDL
ncbi:Protein STRUBBELIG-RECEPTOR FAMILY 8 [Camellia lanceoleosa]|uniref:Protein STRUBBELIG-RECEPTOR FAMILY 8 n=1 Tax=Camellia lanceoleosa TaxID=1840588 RepID=A0ACC0GKI5_9ERIC|nr:Protein STRUBBELIG-RECEPTOR FAMILY 8 [Camellia lanceoleosa]